MKFIYDMHQMMLEHNIILVYEGEFTQEITKSVLAMAERNMDSIGEESGIKRKVFNVMVECLQNIVKHGEEYISGERQINTAIFMIGKHEDSYIITSGNPIKDEHVEDLRSKLDTINSLDKEGLKNLYKDIIKSGSGLTEKGGAGLGFVDMARKSGQKLEYGFESLGEGRSFFSLKTTVPRL
ncbi:MAG: SiaB family protein kinase [Cyclobacteriaceae bacterium]|nr:SiaB family protein kinase [Cyclobacteriaceae bacterium]